VSVNINFILLEMLEFSFNLEIVYERDGRIRYIRAVFKFISECTVFFPRKTQILHTVCHKHVSKYTRNKRRRFQYIIQTKNSRNANRFRWYKQTIFS